MTSQETRRQSIIPPPTQALYDALHFVGVTQLALPELRVEIRAVAVIGCGGA